MYAVIVPSLFMQEQIRTQQRMRKQKKDNQLKNKGKKDPDHVRR